VLGFYTHACEQVLGRIAADGAGASVPAQIIGPKLLSALHNIATFPLIEDVATTGGQAVEAVDVLRDAGAEGLEVVAVIDRGEGARERLAESGVAFEPLFTRADLGVDQPPS